MIMINDEIISQVLSEVVEHLRTGDLYQAEAGLERLGFERLLHPIQSQTKGPELFMDPSSGFGAVRVARTGGHVRACISAINSNDTNRALEEAEAAVLCWKLPKE